MKAQRNCAYRCRRNQNVMRGAAQRQKVDYQSRRLSFAATGMERTAIEWRQGDAASLPFNDASFDVVVSQFELMYFPDRVAAQGEMWRTLAPGGRLAVAVWAPIDHARAYQTLVGFAARQCGRQAAGVLAAPFVLGNQAELAKSFVDSGISGPTLLFMKVRSVHKGIHSHRN